MPRRSLAKAGHSSLFLNGSTTRAKNELSVRPENARAAYLGGTCLAAVGEREQAREWAARALAIDPDDVMTQYNVACTYSQLGDLDQAFDLLERLIPNAGQEMKRGWLQHDSDLDPLRSHPRYQKILKILDAG